MRANSLGTKEEWSGYDTSVRQYEAEAVEQGYAKDVDSLRTSAACAGRAGSRWMLREACG